MYEKNKWCGVRSNAGYTKKIARKIEDIGTDIYQASLPGRSITERE